MACFTFWNKTRFFLLAIVFVVQNLAWAVNTLFPYYTVCINNNYADIADKPYSVAKQNWLNISNAVATFISSTCTVLFIKFFGVKKTFFVLSFFGAVITLVYNFWFSESGFGPYIVYLFLFGISLGCTQPMLFGFINKWTPQKELGFFTGVAMTTFDLPNLISGQYYGLVCEPMGPQNLYLIIGIVYLVSLLVLLVFYTENPAHNRFISAKELKYIQENQSAEMNDDRTGDQKVPYLAMLTDPPVILAILLGAPVYVAYYSMFVTTPTFVNLIYGTSDLATGYISTIGYGVSVLLKIFWPLLDSQIRISDKAKFYVYGIMCTVATTATFVLLALAQKDSMWMVYVALIIYGGMGFCSISFNRAVLLMTQQYSGTYGAFYSLSFAFNGIIFSLIMQSFVNLDSEESFRIAWFVIALINLLAYAVQLAVDKLEPRPFTRLNASSSVATDSVVSANGKEQHAINAEYGHTKL